MPAVWETDSDMLRRTSGGWPTKRSSIRLTPCPARNALTNAGEKVHQYYGPFLPKTANCSQTVISATSSPHREPLAVGREFARYQFYMVAEMLWQSRKRWGRITDISPAGMFIEIPGVSGNNLRHSFRLWRAGMNGESHESKRDRLKDQTVSRRRGVR